MVPTDAITGPQRQYCWPPNAISGGPQTSKYSAKGKYKGRKRVLTAEQVDKARARIEAGEGPSVIARNLGVGRSTLYRALQRVEAGGRGRTSH